MDYKEWCRNQFDRGDKNSRDHGQSGTKCNHKTIPGIDILTKQDHDLMIERQAARLGAVID